MSYDQETITLPWPVTENGVPGDAPYLRVGDRTWLRHVVRSDWLIEATITRVRGIAFGPGKSIEVCPDEPITSPANWIVEP